MWRRWFATSTAGSGSSQRPRRSSTPTRIAARPRTPLRRRTCRAGRDAPARTRHVRERPHASLGHEVDGGGGEHLIVVVNQLRERVFGIATTGPVQQVDPAHAFVLRHVLDDEHHAFPQRAGQHVVEVLAGTGARARVALLDREPCRTDVVRGKHEAEQAEDAIPGPLLLLLERARGRYRVRSVLRPRTSLRAASGRRSSAGSRPAPASRSVRAG